ncbi:YwiC-like family protein [Spirillospora albida]|uniref:YwiC-like family protein n=1 Tax=Spirillospora albida TaxID=58123 RepID=UPI0004C1E0EF|nr:YwiC-like family protein [Spirillospora albida]
MVQTARPPASERRRAPSGRRRRWVPPQHGAWAMLLVPYLAGLLIVGFSWPALPLLVAWIAGYLLSYYALLAVKVRRFGRFRPQILAYGTAVPAAGTTVLAARPEVLLFAPVFGAVLLVNGAFAARHDDRALLNGLVSAAAATAVLPVVAVVAGESPRRTGEAVLVTFLYFAGTVLFVKTCIRERDNTALFAVSAGFHAAALAVVTWLSWVYTGPFAWYLVRAVVLRRRGLPAKKIGMIEVASSIVLLVALAIAA